MRLKLVLKKQWYDLIDKGIKKEEYRDNTQYYRNIFWDECCCWKDYDEVTFYHGYATDRPSMTFKIKDIMLRNYGLPEWGWPENDMEERFVVILGKRIQ